MITLSPDKAVFQDLESRKSHSSLNDKQQDVALGALNTTFSPSVKRKRKIGCAVGLITTGVFMLILAILSVSFQYLDLALNERIKMRPGLPPFEKWKNPTGIEFRVKVFLFAVQNPIEFLNGTDKVLRFKEIGPISYRNKMRHEDIVFHDEDSTLSYTKTNDLEFLENEHEPGFLNQSITIVNPMLLGLAAHIHGQFIAKIAFDLLAAKDHVFLERTIYDILWNCTSPVLEIVKQIPFVVPRPNAGVMFNSFYPTLIRYNVNYGSKHGYENFFKINTLNGQSKINVYENNYPRHCPYSLKGARDGSGMPPHITKDTVIDVYLNNLCRTYPLVFNRTLKYKGKIDAYEFVFADDIYKRHEDPHLDCLKQTGTVRLPDGLSDTSRCAFGMPVSVSNAHFWGFHGDWEKYIGGLNPNEKDHASYFIIEPTSGIQLEAVARIQSNIPMPSLKSYPKDIQRFSNMVLPTFWIELHVTNKDPITMLLIQILNYLPIIQPIVILILFSLSAFYILKGVLLVTSVNFKFLTRADKAKEIVYPQVVTAAGKIQ